eukprot:g3738.t1
MKQTFVVLVYCFVFASSYSIRVEKNVDQKLKQMETVLSPVRESKIKAREVSTDSVLTNSRGVFAFKGRRKINQNNDLRFKRSVETASHASSVPCATSLPKNSNARATEGRLRLFPTASLENCCEKCRMGTYGICRSWWRANGNGHQNCYLNRNI